MPTLTPSLENYLEAVYVLSKEHTVVRIKHLTEYFQYKVSSVNKAMQLLAQEGLVNHIKYGHIEMTEKGLVRAKKIYNKHLLFFSFLTDVIGIDKETAWHEACALEHVFCESSYEKVVAFIEKQEKK